MTRVLIMATNGFEQSELTGPRDRLEQAGIETRIASPEAGEIRGWQDKDWGETVAVDLENHEHLDICNEVIHTGERLDIEYWKPNSDGTTSRRITVRGVFSFRGHWYVRADDDLRNASRTFRVDRIKSVSRTDQFVEVVDAPTAAPDFFTNDSQGETVVLKVGPKAEWVVENYPYTAIEYHDDNSITVTLIANSEHWLGRLLLRAGSEVSVVSPGKWVDLGARTAAAVLARYSEDRPGS